MTELDDIFGESLTFDEYEEEGWVAMVLKTC